MGLLAPYTPKEEEKSPKSGGVPAHKRFSDFGDFSICGVAADFMPLLPKSGWLFPAQVSEVGTRRKALGRAWNAL